MGMLPSPLAVMQQCRLESGWPCGVGNTPLVKTGIKFSPVVLAIHLHTVSALVLKKALGVCPMLPFTSGLMLIGFQLLVPQPCAAVIALDGLKAFEVVSGGLTEATGQRTHGSSAHGNRPVDGNIPGDIQQMLTGMIDIAVRPILHPLIHFLQHLADGYRQHHVPQHRNKQGCNVDQ